jgi:hypothetical protein
MDWRLDEAVRLENVFSFTSSALKKKGYYGSLPTSAGRVSKLGELGLREERQLWSIATEQGVT